MRKKLAQKLFFLAIVYSSTLYISPVLGEDYHIKTDVAVQEETTNLTAQNVVITSAVTIFSIVSHVVSGTVGLH